MNKLSLLVLLLAGCGDDGGAAGAPDLAVAGGGNDLGVSADLAGGGGGDGGSTCAYDETSDGTAKLLAIYTLPPTSMAILNPYLTATDLANAITNGAMTTDDPGPGSGLEYAGGCPGTFYMITDRGPNGSRTAGDGVFFPLPAFTPTVLKVHGDEGSSAIVIDSVLPIRNDNGDPITGISNGSADDTPFLTDTAATPLAYDPDGLDTEDLRRLPSGDYAFTDEYSPSVGIVDGTTGHVKVRYVPSGVAVAARYSVAAILPSVLTNRRANKGFEGLALAPDGHTAWAVLQTPMGDDGASKYGNSLVDRVVRIDNFDDPTHATVGGHFIVLHQTAAALLAGADQKNIYYNSATWLSASKLLLLERVSNPTEGMPGHLTLVVADFTSATNLVGHPELGESTLDPETVGPPAGYVTLAITPATTSVVFDSNDVPTFLQMPPGGAVTPDKLEGVAVINKTTVAISDDNDFGITNANDKSRIWILRTKAPLF